MLWTDGPRGVIVVTLITLLFASTDQVSVHHWTADEQVLLAGGGRLSGRPAVCHLLPAAAASVPDRGALSIW